MRQVFRTVAAPEKDQLPQERSRIKPKLRSIGMHLAVPLLATIGTGPLIAHYFGHLSLAGFVSNPIVVPLVGFVVVPLGLAISFISLAWPEFCHRFSLDHGVASVVIRTAGGMVC